MKMEKISKWRASWFLLFTWYCSSNEVQEIDIGSTCSRLGRLEKYTRNFNRKSGREESLIDLSIDGRIVLKWILEKWHENVDWVQLFQDSIKWRTFWAP